MFDEIVYSIKDTLIGDAMKNEWLNKSPKIPFDKQIEDILENFDFDRVLIAMRALDWQWASCYGRSPSSKEMKAFTREYLERISEEWEQERREISCGGFKVEIHEDGAMVLSFVLCEWDTFLMSDE